MDICRALSAAIFGVPDNVRFVQASSVATFRRTTTIDVVSRRLTWELRRESPLGLLFGPITFYDGQGFLVANRIGAATTARLSGVSLCVAGGTPFEFNVGVHFRERNLELNKVVLESPDKFDDIAAALAGSRCVVYTADVSELRCHPQQRMSTARATATSSPRPHLAGAPRAARATADDPQFYDILRWTVFALIEAERLGVTSANVDEMKKRDSVEVQRLLGVGTGERKALSVCPSMWAYNVIKALGNYGEMFERTSAAEAPSASSEG